MRKEFKRQQEHDDLGVYSEDMREMLLENDELDPAESAFLKGYEDAI